MLMPGLVDSHRQPPPPLLEAMGSSLGADAEQPLPPQADAFTLEGALQAYTLAGARQMGLEAITAPTCCSP